MFNNMKIAGRLALSFGVMVVLMIVLITVSLVSANIWNMDIKSLAEDEISSLQYITKMTNDTREMSIQLRNLLIDPDRARYEEYKKEISDYRADYDTGFKKYQELITTDEMSTKIRDMVAKIKVIQEASRVENNKVIDLVLAGKKEEAISEMNNVDRPKVREWLNDLDELIQLENQSSSSIYEHAVNTGNLMRLTLIIIGAMATLLAVVIGIALTRSITRPIEATTSFIANRDLTVDRSAYTRGKNELAYMLQSFIKDTAERMKLEGETRAAAVYARNLIEASVDPLVTISPEGKITDVNETTIKVTGISRDRLVGTDFADYFTEPAKAKAGYQTVFNQGFVKDYPLTLRHTSGKLTDVLYNASVYRDEAGKVKGVFAAARDVTEQVKISEELKKHKESLEETVKQRTAMLTSVLKEVRETVNVLAASTTEIMTTTSQLSASSSETATAVGETTTTIEEVKHTVQMANEKAQQVSSNAQRTVQVSQDGKKATDLTIQGMTRIREQMESIAETIVKLSEQSQSIGGIVASVTDIAEQSNLLAVNASIEAARAGEQGKGFAVVAQEIKSLAEQSKQATSQVRLILSDVQKAISSAVMVTEQGNKAVDAGTSQAAVTEKAILDLADSVNEAAQAATQIAASSQQQMVGMDQVALAMENISQAASQNANGVKQIDATVQTLHELGQKMKQILEQYKE